MSRPSIVIERVTGSYWRCFIFQYIKRHHRHHAPPVGWKFGLIARRGSKIVGVAVIGRPVARAYAGRLEVTRVCVAPGSAGYGACSRFYISAAEHGASLTYTLATESGASLIAAGWVAVAPVKGRDWAECARRAGPKQVLAPWEKLPTTQDKIRWEPKQPPANAGFSEFP